MNILAVDTALGACSVAAISGPEVRAHRWLAMPKGHAEALAPMVDAVMREARWAFSNVSRLGVTTGPGTFTGQRVGLAFMRGLKLALGVPLVGMTTLEAMAAAAASEGGTDLVGVLHEARRGEAYGALLAGGRLVLRPQLAGVETMWERMRVAVAERGTRGPILFAGTGADAAAAWFCAQGLEARLTEIRQPDALWVARLALAAPEPRETAKPLYLRAPDARLAKAALSVRRAVEADSALLAALDAACLPEVWEAGFFEQILKDPGGFAFIGEANGVPLGFVLGRRAADEAEILALGVLPAYRRNGLGGRLVRAAAVRAQALGATALFLEVAVDNGAARALYAAHGFCEAGARKRYYGAGAGGDALVLRGAPSTILAVGIDGEVA